MYSSSDYGILNLNHMSFMFGRKLIQSESISPVYKKPVTQLYIILLTLFLEKIGESCGVVMFLVECELDARSSVKVKDQKT